jgi:hypothetical protein
MRAAVYAEYVEHPSIPGGRYTIGLDGRAMTLGTSEGEDRRFRNRAACLKWLAATMPDALIYAFDEGVTLCAGSARGLAERAGIEVPDAPLFT